MNLKIDFDFSVCLTFKSHYPLRLLLLNVNYIQPQRRSNNIQELTNKMKKDVGIENRTKTRTNNWTNTPYKNHTKNPPYSPESFVFLKKLLAGEWLITRNSEFWKKFEFSLSLEWFLTLWQTLKDALRTFERYLELLFFPW